MTHEDAYRLLTIYLKSPHLIKHCLATEATMRALYKRLHTKTTPEEELTWGITGLLHDADYELAKNHPEKHGLLLFEKNLMEFPPEIAYAIKAHNYKYTKVQPNSPMDWSICCCDELTGLVVASALVHPDRKLASLDVDFVMNRYGEKSFAKGANREQIALCEQQLGIPLREFVEITLKAMQGISSTLGL